MEKVVVKKDEVDDYFLGLDMGTSSVGWAATDSQYRLLRAKGKDEWGIREFEEAETAIARRTNRISRRRRQREKYRIGYLKSYFDDEIKSIDPNFYARLDNSKYFIEDKDEEVRYKYAIFNDDDYNDVDYYNQYPTIFHLRKALIEDNVQHDKRYSRLVYLSLLNLFKRRGHFLNENVGDDVDVTAINDFVTQFVNASKELGVKFNNVDSDAIRKILSNRDASRKKKSEQLNELFETEKMPKESKGVAVLLLKCLCGLKIDLAKIFELNIEDDKKIEIDFSSTAYEDTVEEVLEAIGEENFVLIDTMKKIYDIAVLSTILGKNQYLSFARVEAYEKHKSDLKKLKTAVLKYCPDNYDDLFRKEIKGSYSAYVLSVNTQKEGLHNRRGVDGRKTQDLYATIKKMFEPYKSEDDVAEILKEIENENFLLKQLTSSNGVIPNQVHKRELKTILKNAEKYLHFLSEKDESGLSVSKRIEELFSFHMPYYIGPVANGSGWVERIEDGPVLPWNYKQKIDIETTSEKFITNLIRECTYISNEKVMPKASLMYERYCVLNEINNITLRNERISVELKQEIYENLFEKGKKVTRKQLLQYLQTKDKSLTDADISGIDININNYLASYGKFHGIFGEKMKNDSYKQMCEEIIRFATIYCDDKKRLRQVLERKYSNDLSAKDIDRILGMKFKDWGRFSKAFLCLEGCEKGTGEVRTLISALWETTLNSMELIFSDEFTYKESLENRRRQLDKDINQFEFEDLDDFYFSAPVKRMIWQTLSIIKELKAINGKAPKSIFIEMTRTDEEKGDKGRKDSRGKKLLDLYKSIKDDTHNWNELIKNEENSGRLKSKKMYLYIRQMGRDIYTGKEIDLSQLWDDNIYDIDHIYPRQFTKDDNIENNLVLVNKQYNAKKTNNYPLDANIRNNPDVNSLWMMLHQKGLMNDEKYHRLTRTTGFTDEERTQFIARQLVETGQATKGIADLLKSLLPETRIVYSKAGNVSAFRKRFDLLKCRLVNDFHHAHDAYLNIVVGNVYDTKFTSNPKNFIIKEYNADSVKNHYNLERMFDWNVERSGKVAWIASTKDSVGTITTVKNVLARTTPLFTRMSFEGHGAITNATLYSADVVKEKGYIPLKATDKKLANVSRYGGFTSASTAYFFLVEHEVKGKKIRTIETVPIYMKAKIEKEPNGLYKYCVETLGLKNPEIRLKKIKIQSHLKLNDYFVYISGKTENRFVLYNAVNMCVDDKWEKYIREMEAYGDNKYTTLVSSEKNMNFYLYLLEKHKNSIFRNRPNPIFTTLEKGKELFEKLELEKQINTLLEVVKATAIGSISGVNLSNIGGAKTAGTMKTGMEISGNKNIMLINQSVTGLICKSIDLLTV